MSVQSVVVDVVIIPILWKSKFSFFLTGYLEAGSENEHIVNNTKMELPLWMARPLHHRNTVSIGLCISTTYVRLPMSHRFVSLTGSFTKPLAHGFMAGYFFEPITVHGTEVLKNLIG